MNRNIIIIILSMVVCSFSYAQTNLIVNGDFDDGNSGFVNDYTFDSGFECLWSPAEYTVDTNPNYVHSGFAKYGDHTTGEGNMMIVNGSEDENTRVWEQTVEVNPHTLYEFVYYLSRCDTDTSANIVPASIQANINGTILGTFTAPLSPGIWNSVSYSWNSGTNTSATITLIDTETVYSSNDFALDDISLQSVGLLGVFKTIGAADDLDAALNNSVLQFWSGIVNVINFIEPGDGIDPNTGKTYVDPLDKFVIAGTTGMILSPSVADILLSEILASTYESFLNSRDYFIARFTGKINITEAGVYTFSLGHDDGARLIINGYTVINSPDPTWFTTVTGSVSLEAGWYPIVIELHENTGDANLVFKYQAPSASSLTVVPSCMLRPDKEGPIVTNLALNSTLIPVGNTAINLSATVDDTQTGNTCIYKGEYNINGGEWIKMDTVDDNGYNSPVEDVATLISTSDLPAGVYNICVRGTDSGANVGEEVCIYFVVYDPSEGFVTGGGWINSPEGAYVADPSLTGKANFGFVAKYKKGATVPSGQTEFQFKAGSLNFHSSAYEWLVVANAKAMFKGEGTINGIGNYGFILSAIDAELTPSTNLDLFRIKIWDKTNDALVYDNQVDDSEDFSDPTTAIGDGDIVIHTK